MSVSDEIDAADGGTTEKPERDRLGATQSALRQVVPPLMVVILMIILWESFIELTGQPAYILPPLSTILSVAIDDATNRFLPASWVTLQEMLLGFGFGVGVGLALAIAIFHSATLSKALMPLLIATQAIPVIAIAPILIIWFGFDMMPKVIVAALICFFPIVVTTLAGLNSVDKDSINLMHSLGANRWQVFAMLHFPSALPFIFAGVKNAAAISAIGAIVGEWVGASAGLGPVMIAANASFKTEVVFAAIFYLAFMSISLFLIVSAVERWAIPWHFLTRGKRH